MGLTHSYSFFLSIIELKSFDTSKNQIYCRIKWHTQSTKGKLKLSKCKLVQLQARAAADSTINHWKKNYISVPVDSLAIEGKHFNYIEVYFHSIAYSFRHCSCLKISCVKFIVERRKLHKRFIPKNRINKNNVKTAVARRIKFKLFSTRSMNVWLCIEIFLSLSRVFWALPSSTECGWIDGCLVAR